MKVLGESQKTVINFQNKEIFCVKFYDTLNTDNSMCWGFFSPISSNLKYLVYSSIFQTVYNLGCGISLLSSGLDGKSVNVQQ